MLSCMCKGVTSNSEASTRHMQVCQTQHLQEERGQTRTLAQGKRAASATQDSVCGQLTASAAAINSPRADAGAEAHGKLVLWLEARIN